MADAGHALRTPLTSIKDYSSALLQADIEWPPEMHREFLVTIDQETDQLNRAIDDLLGSSGSNATALLLDRSMTTVEDLLRWLMLSWWPRACAGWFASSVNQSCPRCW